MKTKQYLMQIQKLNRLIENKLAEQLRWQEMATGVSMSLDADKVQASGNKQRMESAICQYLSIESDVQEQIRELMTRRQQIISIIEELPPTEYDILHKKYVQLMEFSEIGDTLKPPRSYSSVIKIHGKALLSVQKILDEAETPKLGH